MTFKELKTIKDSIAAAYNIDTSAAARIVGYYNAGPGKDEETMQALLMGDLSSVPAAASALGIKFPDQGQTDPEKITAKDSTTLLACPRTNETISTIETPNNNSIETIQADIMPEDDLPPGLFYDIKEWLVDFAQEYNIDLDKCSNLQWRGICLLVGDKFKASGFFIDRVKQKRQGGKPYKAEKIAAIIPIWEKYTALYKHVPLASDFIAFTGISREYFYDSQAQGLSSSQLDLIKKVQAIEEAALGTAITDHRENPTGRIYYTKARLGWRETAAADAAPAVVVVSLGELPKLDKIGG